MTKVYYTIEKNENKWIVWRNVEDERACGCFNIYSSENIKDCRKFCKDNNYKARAIGLKNNI